MKCPACGGLTEVKDSRPRHEDTSIRRRRVCADCGFRSTTFELFAPDAAAVLCRDGTILPLDGAFIDKLAGDVSRHVSGAIRDRLGAQLNAAGDA